MIPISDSKQLLLRILLEEMSGVPELQRVREMIHILLGDKEPSYPQAYHTPPAAFLPGLSSKPWYEPDEFEETRRLTEWLEGSFDEIKQEFLQVMAEASAADGDHSLLGRYPHRAIPDEMNRWRAFYLRELGLDIEENQERCPQAARFMDEMGSSLFPAGEVFYSVLPPGMHIPPHNDMVNVVLTCHFALAIPPDCSLRVGSEKRTWQEGKCLFFDPTFEHEVWNHGDHPRVCFLFDIWHPELRPEEIEALGTVTRIVLAQGQ